jgi:hypothetical protein
MGRRRAGGSTWVLSLADRRQAGTASYRCSIENPGSAGVGIQCCDFFGSQRLANWEESLNEIHADVENAPGSIQGSI